VLPEATKKNKTIPITSEFTGPGIAALSRPVTLSVIKLPRGGVYLWKFAELELGAPKNNAAIFRRNLKRKIICALQRLLTQSY